jgi:AraC family transcriptional regulator of adaptative response/methylated-DNA-[protein]-cysteine methyltransferase
MVSCEAMTPGDIQAAARGIDIGHGIAPTPFGDALVAWTARGVCHFAFRGGEDDSESAGDQTMLAALRARWPAAALHRDADGARALMQRIFPHAPERGRVHLVLRGTNFQVKGWDALIRIPSGHLRSYRQLATTLGQRDAARALGGALAANAIGYLIPCHRVIRAGGEVGDYRWGSERKLALLGCEAARHGD